MKTLIINRRKWLRGGDSSQLLATVGKNKGKMCCLGFLACDCGYSKNEIENKLTPADTKEKHKWPNGLAETIGHFSDNSYLCDQMMKTNDDSTLTPKEREDSLKKLFKKINYKLVFKN